MRAKDGLPMASAFQMREGEEALSVSWLEFWNASSPASAIDQARSLMGRNFALKVDGRFARLNVGRTMQAVHDATRRRVRIEHLPTDEDPAHAGISGYSADDLDVAQAIAEIVAREDVYPAVV